MLRRFLARLRANPLFLAAAAILAVAVVMVGSQLLGQSGARPSPASSGSLSTTYDRAWTFPELTRQIEAGGIASI